jgi:hypothetical protein
MAKTASTMLPLGTKAPEFLLPEVSTLESISLSQLRGENGALLPDQFLQRRGHSRAWFHVQIFHICDLGLEGA